jgi:membrane protease subunit HflK
MSSTMLLVFALTTITDVSFVVQFLIALIGLGVAIDYFTDPFELAGEGQFSWRQANADPHRSGLERELQGFEEACVFLRQADGDAQRFRSVLAEYQRAPAVTRDRLYLETMQQVYSSVSKVMIDSRSGSNLLYLPLDKLLQQGAVAGPAATTTPPTGGDTGPSSPSAATDVRSRDGGRSRDREGR